MIPLVFNGATAYLIDDQPQWDDPVQVEASVPNIYERGLSGRETRRQKGDTLRLEMKWTSLVQGAVAITNLRNALQALNVQEVLCPFWPGQFAAGTLPVVTGAWYVLLDDSGAAPSVQPAAALPFARTAYPLMLGRLLEIPQPDLPHDQLAKVDYHFADQDIYPLTFPVPAQVNGLNAAGGAGVRPLFPWDNDWSTDPVSGESEQDVDWRQLGELRQMSSAYYTQKGRRKFSQYFKLLNNDGVNFLGFFASMGGEQNNFWIGASLSEATLTANVAAAAMALQVDNGANLGTNSFVLLNDNINRVPVAVANVAGNTWNLVGPTGTVFGANTTRLESLVLGRFDTLKLTVNFYSAALADCKVNFKELPWETNAVAGETYGTTMGALPMTAILFVFSQVTPSGTTMWRLTNFERNLVDAGANTYLSAPIEFDNIVETAVLDRQSLELKSRNFAGNPLSLMVPLQLEWPLMLTIIEADLSVAGAVTTAVNPRTYFWGEVGKCNVEPPFITATCSTLSNVFDRNVPRRLLIQTDNWCLFEAANGLLPAAWQWNATVVSYTPATGALVVSGIAANGANPNNAAFTASPAHWFAFGYCIITTAGAQQVRMISDNVAPVAGQITLSLATPLNTAPNVGDAVQMFAGYDMQASTAINKYNNYANFGGMPFIPIGNLTVFRITQPTGSGKK
jgi:hypothetical protein